LKEELRSCAIGVWHISFAVINNLNDTDTAMFAMQAVLPQDFPFLSDKFN